MEGFNLNSNKNSCDLGMFIISIMLINYICPKAKHRIKAITGDLWESSRSHKTWHQKSRFIIMLKHRTDASWANHLTIMKSNKPQSS